MFLLPKSGVHYFNLKVPFTRNQADLYKAYSNVRYMEGVNNFSNNMIMISNRFDIYAAHGRWNASEVKSLIPGGYAMTILRNPLDAFESYYSYMNIDSKLNMDINEFAMALAIRNVRDSIFDDK